MRGMYASAAGMLTGIARQDLYAGNLANVDTAGYRRTRCGARAFADKLQTASLAGNRLRGGAGPITQTLDLSEGPNQPTCSKFDFAINGPGMFAVQTPQGMCYTRDGRFQLSAAGRLVDAHGNAVIGVNGYIDVPPGGDFQVSETGQVKSGARVLGDILIAQLPAATLRPAGGNLYTSAAMPQRSPLARIMQGSIEQSNVRAVGEMGAMMQNSRYYEANAAALKQQDQATEQLVRMME